MKYRPKNRPIKIRNETSPFFQDSNFRRAQKILGRTLCLARNVNSFGGVVCTCDMLAEIETISGNGEEAESHLLQAIDYLSKNGIPDDDNLIINFQLKLSRLQYNKGDVSQAEEGFKRCLRIQKQKVTYVGDDDTKVLLATVLYWYGKFLLNTDKFEEAKSFLEDCHYVCSKARWVHPNQMVLVLYNLGEVCHILGEFDKALGYFTDAVALDGGNAPSISLGTAKMAAASAWRGVSRTMWKYLSRGIEFIGGDEHFQLASESSNEFDNTLC